VKTTIVIESGKVTVTTDDGKEPLVVPYNKLPHTEGSSLIRPDVIPLRSEGFKETGSDPVKTNILTPRPPFRDRDGSQTCLNCHEPIIGKRKDSKYCDKPECKKVQKAEYMKRWHEKHSGNNTDTNKAPIGVSTPREEWPEDQVTKSVDWPPKPKLPEPAPTATLDLGDQGKVSIDPWDCQMCRDGVDDRCDFHRRMELAGRTSPFVQKKV